MKTLWCFLSILILAANINNAQWFWQNPKITGEGINKIYFAGNTGWMAGMYGTILKSTNAGQKWEIIQTGTKQVMNSIHFITEDEGWCTGGKLIIKTTNGGLSWVMHQIDTVDNLNSVMFINRDTGWVIGKQGGGSSSNNYIYKTTNGGNSWVAKWVQIGSIELKSIYFWDPIVGYSVGKNGKIFRTTDGGENWAELQSGTSQSLNSVQFTDIKNGIIAGGYGTILKTTNGGNNWITQNSGTSIDLYSIHMIHNQTGWIVGGDYNSSIILNTTNSGVTWSTQYSGTLDQLNSVYFIDDQTGWAVGGTNYASQQLGVILKTTNGGENWTHFNEVKWRAFNSMCFTTPQTGWAATGGGEYMPNKSYILKSVNGGNDWDIQRVDSNIYNGIHFVDSLNGWAVGNGIYKTTDGGLQWSVVPYGAGKTWRLIQLFDDQNGWVERGGEILRTTDGGSSWDSLIINGYEQLFFISPQIGWLLYVANDHGDYGLKKTTDGGINWVVFEGLLSGKPPIYFFSQDIGYVASSYAHGGHSPVAFYKTTDGGLTWSDKYCDNQRGLFASTIIFISRDIGYASGGNDYYDSYGCIFKTTDGGESWHTMYETSLVIDKVYFYDESTGWAYSNSGILLKTTNGGVTFIEEKHQSETPNSYSLSQNYPNPFNPSTKIKYTIPMDNGHLIINNVSLKVFDILGREVVTLVDEEQMPGSYEVEFSVPRISNPPLVSGVYFYQLRAGADIVITRKMLLLK